MSDLGLSPAAPHDPAPPDDGSASGIPLWLVVGAIVLMVAGAGLVAVVLLVGKDAKAAPPSYPTSWDPRIAPYVKIVEKQRGLTFLHPVAVRFLPADAFEKGITADKKKLDDEQRKQIEQGTGLLRALGLITGDVDLFDAFNQAHGSGTLAYYSFADHRITVRGTKITPAVRSTLVHELTHALQDQHFGVGDRMKKLGKKSGKGADAAAESVLDAITEGDAERVETLYRDSLTPKQRKALDASRRSQNDEAGAKLAKIPKVVLTEISAPYTLGQALVQTVAANGGNAAVDALFRDTPTHEAALLDPFQVLAGDTDAADVDTPKLAGQEKKFDSGEFGVLGWYLMLAERLPLTEALDTVDGWGGDAYVAFERNGTSCARAAYTGDTPADTARMLRSLQAWIAAAPGSPAQVNLAGDVVRFESCDPGTTATVGKDASADAIDLATVRTYVGLAIIRSGGPKELARCVAGQLVREYPVASLVDPTFGVGDPNVRARIQQIAAACR